MRARKRQGFGWKRWSREWIYNVLGLFNDYRVSLERISPESCTSTIGLITLTSKQESVVREIRIATFDAAGAETQLTIRLVRHSRGNGEQQIDRI